MGDGLHSAQNGDRNRHAGSRPHLAQYPGGKKMLRHRATLQSPSSLWLFAAVVTGAATIGYSDLSRAGQQSEVVYCSTTGIHTNGYTCDIVSPSFGMAMSKSYPQISVGSLDTVTVERVYDGGTCGNWNWQVLNGSPTPLTLTIPPALVYNVGYQLPLSVVEPIEPSPQALLLTKASVYEGDGDFVDCHIRISVTHRPPVPVSDYSMNLVSSARDSNGILLNPQWSYQTYTTQLPDPIALCGGFLALDNGGVSLGTPPCTNQGVTTDEETAGQSVIPFLCKSVGDAVNGHVNWVPATYEGTLQFDEYSTGTFGDGDYNILLIPPNGDGLTVGDPTDWKMEMKDTQTVIPFTKDGNSPLWTRFLSTPKIINDRFGIITGLVGLDGVHGFSQELHPGWAMAVNLDPASNVHGDASHPADGWMFFIRNHGNEGECSSQDHVLNLPRGYYAFHLPWHGRGQLQVQDVKSFSNAGVSIYGPYIRLLPSGDTVEVGYVVPNHSEFRIHGEIYLGGTDGLITAAPGSQSSLHRGQPAAPTENMYAADSDPWTYLVSRIPSNDLAHLAKIYGRAPSEAVSGDNTPTLYPDIAIPAPTRLAPWASVVADPRQGSNSLAAMERLCIGYAGSIPGWPGMCDSIYWESVFQSPEMCMSVVEKHRTQLPILGESTSDLQLVGDGIGATQDFAGATVYWTNGTCAHYLLGEVKTLWLALQHEEILGYPITDSVPTADGVGQYAKFQRGDIYWSPSTSAHEVHGAIREYWASQGAETGSLGYPVSNEQSTPDGLGRMSLFEHGTVVWYSGHPARELP